MKNSKSSLTLILANQLFFNHPALSQNTQFVMVESMELCNRHHYHKFKLAYLLTCLREFKDYLISQKKSVFYYPLDQEISIQKALLGLWQTNKYGLIQFTSIPDKAFRENLEKFFKLHKIPFRVLKSQMFILSKNGLEDYFQQKKTKSLVMNNFYIQRRLDLKILLDSKNKPLGGRWSFDSENRQKLPKSQNLPLVPTKFQSKNYIDVQQLIQTKFPNNPGFLDSFYSWLPLNFEQAKKYLNNFLENRLFHFGAFEDAISNRSDILFHSALSPLLNNGLLTPYEILETLDNFCFGLIFQLSFNSENLLVEGLTVKININNQKKILSLNSIEGFIRQIIGWREWIYGIYEVIYKSDFQTYNFFEANNPLPIEFYHPSKGLEFFHKNQILKDVLLKVEKMAWCHHIERLMILGNWFLLNEYSPKQVYDWYLAMFVDGYEWVMAGNVFGMGLYADGGIFATKPYLSGGNYLKKMSDYQNTEWADNWTEKYWSFLKKHKLKLQDNPRMKLILNRLRS